MTRATFDPSLEEFRPGVFAQPGDVVVTAEARWTFFGATEELRGGWRPRGHEGEPSKAATPAWLATMGGHDPELWLERLHGKRPPEGHHATALGQLLEENEGDR